MRERPQRDPLKDWPYYDSGTEVADSVLVISLCRSIRRLEESQERDEYPSGKWVGRTRRKDLRRGALRRLSRLLLDAIDGGKR